MDKPVVYVFDFDGVLCESVMETAITGWKAAGSIWGDMPGRVPQEKVDQFRLARPIIETGYEAILTMRLLFLDVPIESIHSSYKDKFKALTESAKLTVEGLKKLFGDTRDAWIATDSAGWVGMNPLYDGVAAKLRSLGNYSPWYIVTTKHERFIKLILQANGIELSDSHIYGLDRNMGKPEVLMGILQNHPDETIYFVEDRLPTLTNVLKHGDLATIKLFFALWGYNTPEDKALASNESINLLQLTDLLEF